MATVKEYALYKGDEFIVLGTVDEIAKFTGIKKESVTFYGTPTYKKRNSGENAMCLVKLDDLEECEST